MTKEDYRFLFIGSIGILFISSFIGGCHANKLRDERDRYRKIIVSVAENQAKQRVARIKIYEVESKKFQPSNLEFIDIGRFNISAYTTSDPGCDNTTASGVIADYRDNIIATDWNILPVGTVVYIQNHGFYTVQDKGGVIKGRMIDVLVRDKMTAVQFGRQNLNVWLVKEK